MVIQVTKFISAAFFSCKISLPHPKSAQEQVNISHPRQITAGAPRFRKKKGYFLFLVHTQRALNLYLSTLNFICCSYSSGNVINLPSDGTSPLGSAAAQPPSPLHPEALMCDKEKDKEK